MTASTTEALSLFPVPTLPELAAPHARLAATSAILCHRELGAMLERGGFTTEAVLEIGELIAASRHIHERLAAMLRPAGGKR